MKRWLAVYMAVTMLFVMCGCGSDSRTNITKKEGADSDTQTVASVPNQGSDEDAWAIHDERGYFYNESASPEMSADGPMADVREAYFTQNGHLCVELLISNGTDGMLQINAIDVAAYDYDLDVMFAGGKGAVAEPLMVAAGEITPYTFYISPEHVHLHAQDPMPDMVYFTITLDSASVEAE